MEPARLLGIVNLAVIACAYLACVAMCSARPWTLTDMLRGPWAVQLALACGMTAACLLAVQRVGPLVPGVLWLCIVAVMLGGGALHDVGAVAGFALAIYISWAVRRDVGVGPMTAVDWVTVAALGVSLAGLSARASWGLPLLEMGIVWGTNAPLVVYV